VGNQHHSLGRDQWCMTRRALPMRALKKDTIGIDHDGRHRVWGWEPGVVGECTGAKNDDTCIGTNVGVESQELLENVQVQKMTTHALELMYKLVVDERIYKWHHSWTVPFS